MTTSSLPATELADDRYAGLDTWSDAAILGALIDGQRRAVDAVTSALPAIAEAAVLASAALSAGGRLIYLASGSPALIALGDALELPQTFGIDRSQLLWLFSGGEQTTQNLNGTSEDDAGLGRLHIASAEVGPADCVVAISASGSTPYTVAGLGAARLAGATTVAIAGNAGAPIFAEADVAILLDVGAEVISGSTRMGAGTAQKATLNLFSTLVGVKLGHVHDNLMVNVTADNEKLRQRAMRMVCRITGATPELAQRALTVTNGLVKPAAVLAAGARDRADADAILDRHGGRLRPALAELNARQRPAMT